MRAKELLHTTGVLLSLTVCTPLFAQQEMNWQSGSFPAISLPAITTRGGTASGSASLTLILNGDVDLSACPGILGWLERVRTLPGFVGLME